MRRSSNIIRSCSLAVISLLIVACGASETPPPPPEDDFSFTEEDVAKFRDMVRDAEDERAEVTTGTAAVVRPSTIADEAPAVDMSVKPLYDKLRQGVEISEEDVYRVTNQFLNVRSEPRVTSAAVDRLEQGDEVVVLDFVNGAWAKVRLGDGREGYTAVRYLGKLVAEENLSEEKAAFNGMYFVDFGFLNMRQEPDTESAKLAELPGQAIVRPISMDEVWARIMYDGKEGYVASEYLSPFQPALLVRQNVYRLPVLHYRLSQDGIIEALTQHMSSLRQQGYNFVTLQQFKDILVAQEERDVRLPPKSVAVALSDVDLDSLDQATDVLRSNGVSATIFVPTRLLGIDGITERQVLTMMANGFDIQSGGHSGDDLRSLTASQMELELKQSRALLEEFTDKNIFAVAYPWGGVNDRAEQEVAEAGYLFGIGASPRSTFARNDFLRVPSHMISASLSAQDVLDLLDGE